jgi:hypothetical protein
MVVRTTIKDNNKLFIKIYLSGFYKYRKKYGNKKGGGIIF